MLRDDNSFPRRGMEGLRDGYENENENGDGEGFHDREHRNDELDDVFGSAPGSPAWGSGGEELGDREGGNGSGEFSDVPRLREKHEKEGYRDGVTKGKGESVQRGFDEGFSLGAMVGLRVGRILGVLEGVREGVGVGLGEGDGERERLRAEGIYKEAVEELSTKGIFGKEYWGEDGIWRFEVPEEQGKDVTFEDVARAHPLIKKWEAVVEAEVKKWDLDMGVMDGEHEHDVVDDDIDAAPVGIGKGAVATKKAAEEPAAPPGKIMGIPKSELNW